MDTEMQLAPQTRKMQRKIRCAEIGGGLKCMIEGGYASGQIICLPGRRLLKAPFEDTNAMQKKGEVRCLIGNRPQRSRAADGRTHGPRRRETKLCSAEGQTLQPPEGVTHTSMLR